MFLKKITLLVIMTGAAGLLHGVQPTDTENGFRYVTETQISELHWPPEDALKQLKHGIEYIEYAAYDEDLKLRSCDETCDFGGGRLYSDLPPERQITAARGILKHTPTITYTPEECLAIANNLKVYYNSIANAYGLPEYQS